MGGRGGCSRLCAVAVALLGATIIAAAASNY